MIHLSIRCLITPLPPVAVLHEGQGPLNGSGVGEFRQGTQGARQYYDADDALHEGKGPIDQWLHC
jgi:hypothetical protein